LNVGFVFCKASVSEVADIIKSKKTPAVARPGTFAPSDVWIKAGATGLDPN
jgi:large subunit ribosomal protein LP0